MKITKARLKEIIKEELATEHGPPSGMITEAFRMLDSARVALAKEIGQDPQPLSRVGP